MVVHIIISGSAKKYWYRDGVADIDLVEFTAGTTAAISTLIDVQLTSLTTNDLLKYNGTKWVNTTLVASDIPSLDASKITTGTLTVTVGGTGTSTAFDPGSIIFAGASGIYSQDNSNFFWDNTNKRLGVGISIPTAKIHVKGSGSTLSTYTAQFHNSTGTSNSLTIRDDGFIGIGLSNPSQILDIAGKLAINNNQILYLPNQTNFTGTLIIGNGGGSLSHTTGLEGQYNTFVGIDTGYSNTIGLFNTAIGATSMYSTTSGTKNIAYGYASLYSNITGDNNLAIGYLASYSNTTASNNFAIGFQALQFNTIGIRNHAIGHNALRNITGSYNIGIGYLSGQGISGNAGGKENITIGYFAGASLSTTGDYNIFIGDQAGYINTTGNNNIQVGHNTTGVSITTGHHNVFIGNETGRGLSDNYISTGNYNVIIGAKLQYYNIGSSLSNHVIISDGQGQIRLFSNTVGTVIANSTANTIVPSETLDVFGNIAVSGTRMLSYSTTYTSLFMGGSTGGNSLASGAVLNIFTGPGSGQSITTGNGNISYGHNSLNLLTTGQYNIAIGNVTLSRLTSGYGNTAVGERSQDFNLTGTGNTTMGYAAGKYNTSGNYNVAIGYLAGIGNDSLSDVSYNVWIGESAGAGLRTGATHNVGIGNSALSTLLFSGTDNTVIGYSTGLGIITGSKNTILGANVSGLSSSLSNTIILADGDGVIRWYTNSSGLTGIGTSSPLGKLHVLRSSAVTTTSYAGYFENTNTNTTTDGINKYGIYVTSTGTFTGSTGTATNNYGLYVDSTSGADNNYSAYFANRVGIATLSPLHALHVYGEVGDSEIARFSSQDTTNGYILIEQISNSRQVTIGYIGNIFNIYNAANNSDITFSTTASSVTSEKVRITSIGKVGISTNSPSSWLHIAGSWTTTASLQSGVLMNQTITSRATTSDFVYGMQITPSLISSANSQILYATAIGTYGSTMFSGTGSSVELYALGILDTVEPTMSFNDGNNRTLKLLGPTSGRSAQITSSSTLTVSAGGNLNLQAGTKVVLGGGTSSVDTYITVSTQILLILDILL